APDLRRHLVPGPARARREAMIDVLDAVKTYGSVRVVDGVRLTLPAGGLTSIVGPNGAGKSTLLSLIARLLEMDGGQVLVDGHDVTSTRSAVPATRIAALPPGIHPPP